MPVLRPVHRVLAVAAASALTVTLTGPPASAADDAWDVPPSATITLQGDGFGHGVGLSQYGAYGAANDGKNYKKILRFYYPHTGLGSAKGKIAVRITADDDGDVVVKDRKGLTARRLANGKTWRLREPKADKWRIRAAGSRSVISFRASGKWHEWRTVGGDAELAAGGKPVKLKTPDGVVRYRGALRSASYADGRVTVDVLPLEAYVRGVVASEMFADWPQQALRAQAVASRSYAVHERATTNRTAFDLCDTSACQAYGGADAETGPSDKAVARTAHRIVTYDGEVAFTQFSASDGGWTVAGDYSYLPAREDRFEGRSSDYYGWELELSDAEIEEVYNIEDLTGIQVVARDEHGPRGGRVEEVELTSSTGWHDTVKGASFFRNFGLRSTLFEITDVESR